MTTKPKPPTAAQRKAASRARKVAAGLVRLEVWARAEDHGAIKVFVEMLNKRVDCDRSQG